MDHSRLVTVCLLHLDEQPDQFQRCLWSILQHTPLDRVQLRLGLQGSVQPLYYALGVLCPDGVVPVQRLLPGGIERFHWTGNDGLPLLAWHAAEPLSRQQLTRLVYHDMPLTSAYVVCLEQGACVEAGWWEALQPALEQGIDYLGRPGWHAYLPAEAEQLQNQPWYLGVPFDRREGKIGVSFMTAGFQGIRAERLREANFPPPFAAASADRPPGIASDQLLGEMARQLGWKQAVYETHVQSNHQALVTRNGKV